MNTISSLFYCMYRPSLMRFKCEVIVLLYVISYSYCAVNEHYQYHGFSLGTVVERERERERI